MNCVVCNKELTGRQTKYCSKKCQNTASNNNWQIYSAQQERGLRRKEQLVQAMGGCCQQCGYSNNLAALCFHHREPKDKLFGLDLRSLSNRKKSVIIEESDKCDLLCLNCHAEIHNPKRTLI